MKSKRDRYLQSKYGISEAQYNRMLKDQGDSCAICQRHKSNFSKSLHVDHDHKSGVVRGLLCFYCNKRVVGRHTSLSVVKLVKYLLPGWKLVKS